MFINEFCKVIEMTKTEYRTAHTYGTPEYENLQEVRKAYPGFRVITKERKKTDRLKGLDVDYMKNYIIKHDGKDCENWEVFCQLRGLDVNEEKMELSAAASFGELRMWFLSVHPEVENIGASVDKILENARKVRAEKKANELKAKAATGLN